MADLTSAGRQLVEFTRALNIAARVVLLDEPTSALTAEETAGMFAAVRRFTAAGIAVVYITHRLDEVAQICDRALVLRDGRLVGELPGSAAQEEIVRMMVGRDVGMLFPAKPTPASERRPVLTVSNLRARSVGPVDLELGAGEVLGLVGLLGSAQESVGRAIFGAIRPETGSVVLDGRAVPAADPSAAAAMGMAFLGADRQHEGVVPTMSVKGNVTLCSLPRVSSGPLVHSGKERRLAEALRERYAIRCYGVDQPMDTLSGGNQQKALLARWLAVEPRAVILEEPTHGIDIGAKEEVYRIIRRLAQEGRGIVIVSSDAHEMAGLCDRVIGFDRVKAVGELRGQEVTTEAIVALTIQHGTAETAGAVS